MLVPTNRGATTAIDARLFATDLFTGWAKPLHVIDVDARDNRTIGVDSVHSIEPPAHADFQYRDIEVCTHQQLQRGKCTELEIRERNLAANGFHPGKRLAQLRIGGITVMQPHSLVVTHDMRRGIGAHTVTAGTKNGIQHGHGRALSIGASHRENRERQWEQRQPLEHGADAVKPKLN